MFIEKTVFILGAGASKPYGYPLGADLIADIIKNIEEDTIYIPVLISRNFYWPDYINQREPEKTSFPLQFLEYGYDVVSTDDLDSIKNPEKWHVYIQVDNDIIQYKVRRHLKYPPDQERIQRTANIITGHITQEELGDSITISQITENMCESPQFKKKLLGIISSKRDILHIDGQEKLNDLYTDEQKRNSLIQNASMLFNNKRTPSYDDFYVAIECNLNQIQQFRDLKNSLNQFAPTSIDAFLSHNPSFAKAGKIMIAYSLLKKENVKRFSRQENMKRKKSTQTSSSQNDKEQDEDKEDNWYPCLLNDLTTECADNPEKILKNDLHIITFNYDVSLETYLEEKMCSMQSLKKEANGTTQTIAENYLTQLKKKIYHVYGDLNRHDSNYGEYYSEGNDIILNCGRILKSIELAKNIRTISPERKDKDMIEKYAKIIKKAKNIIIIGFGFDRTNLDQLGLPQMLNDWPSALAIKKPIGYDSRYNVTIKWLNYGNNMTGLSRQFTRLSDYAKIEVIESIATSICNAYQYDFKLFLFE